VKGKIEDDSNVKICPYSLPFRPVIFSHASSVTVILFLSLRSAGAYLST
jgi:NAD kinase